MLYKLSVGAHATAVALTLVATVSWSNVNAGDCQLALAESDSSVRQVAMPLPEREGARTRTSGRVPHVQLGVTPVAGVVDALRQFAFSIPGVTARPTIVSLPGATGMWLTEEVPVVQPKAIVSGREFAHIHEDGSLHTPLPFARAMELAEKGWGERHPWADRRDGWEGLVMLYTPATADELEVTAQLIVESYNHVTGSNLKLNDCLKQ